MRDYLTKVDNSAPLPQGLLTAEEDNIRFEELKQAVATAGIPLDPVIGSGSSTDTQMLAQAIARYASGAIFCRDTGVLNAYIVSPYNTFIAPKALFQGLRVSFYPGNTNTGDSTLNAFSLGVKKLLRPNGSALNASDVYTNVLTEAYYDTTADSGVGAWRIAPWALYAPIITSGGGGGGGGSTAPLDGEGIDVDVTYHVSLNFPGLTSATPVDADYFAFWSVTGSHHRSVTLATLKSLLTSTGTPYYAETASETITAGNYSVATLVMPFTNKMTRYTILVTSTKLASGTMTAQLQMSLDGGSNWINVSQYGNLNSANTTNGTFACDLTVAVGANTTSTVSSNSDQYTQVLYVQTATPTDVRFRIYNQVATLSSTVMRGKKW